MNKHFHAVFGAFSSLVNMVGMGFFNESRYWSGFYFVQNKSLLCYIPSLWVAVSRTVALEGDSVDSLSVSLMVLFRSTGQHFKTHYPFMFYKIE
jgi:hypothetical protein